MHFTCQLPYRYLPDTDLPLTHTRPNHLGGLVFFVRIELSAHGEHCLGHLVAHYVADRSEIAMTNQVLGDAE